MGRRMGRRKRSKAQEDIVALRDAGFRVKFQGPVGLEHKIVSAVESASNTKIGHPVSSEREAIRQLFFGEEGQKKENVSKFKLLASLAPFRKVLNQEFEVRPFKFLRAFFPKPEYDNVRPRILNEIKEVHTR